MRQFHTAALLLVMASVSMMSCGDSVTPQSLDEIERASDAVVIQDPKITTLPIDDIAEYIVEMPDGIHLRPGVQIFEVEEALVPYVSIQPNSPIVRVHGAAVEPFSKINPNDAVFIQNMGFIVEGVTYEHDSIVFEVSPFDLSRVIWGNFHLEYEINMAEFFGADFENDAVFVPIVDEFGNVTKSQAVEIEVSQQLNKNWTVAGSGTFNMSGRVRTPLAFKGVFEGRIGRFKSEYVCKGEKTSVWGVGDFCVDRIAAYVELTFEAEARLRASFTASVEWSDSHTWRRWTAARVPLGPTGLSIDPIIFLKSSVSAKASGTVTVEYNYNFHKKVPVGFEYRNLPRSYTQHEGLFTIPNSRFPITGSGSSHNFNVSGDVTLEYSTDFFILGVEFAVSAAAGVAKIIGAEIKGVVTAKTEYRPYNRDTDGYCLKAGVTAKGVAGAKIQFEVDLRVWSWKTNLACPDDENCAEISTRDFGLIGPETTDRFCLNRPQFRTLVIEPHSDPLPAGFDDVPGYDVDSVCLTRVRNNRRSEWCATSGPQALRGRPDSTCPLQTSKVAGLQGRTEVSFDVPVEPGDRIVVVQSRTPGACNGSGKARFSLKSGNTTRMLGDGAYFESNVSLTVPQ